MSAKLIETATALRKMSAENKSAPDAIDEAADLLEAAAKAETVALKSIQAVRRFANEMRSLASMQIDHDCTSEQFVNFWKVRANIWMSELAEDLPDLDSGDCATPLAAIDDLQDEITRLRTQRDFLISAVRRTLDENGHLADGENCTLIALKRAFETIAEVGAGDKPAELHNAKVSGAGTASAGLPGYTAGDNTE